MDRMITTELLEEDLSTEGILRPDNLTEYIGQEKVKHNLNIFIEAAKIEEVSRSCSFLRGFRDWEKPRWHGIIAHEMGSHFKDHLTAIEKPGEIAAVLNGLADGDVLFIDEIHRLQPSVEESLYPAMEVFLLIS